MTYTPRLAAMLAARGSRPAARDPAEQIFNKNATDSLTPTRGLAMDKRISGTDGTMYDAAGWFVTPWLEVEPGGTFISNNGSTQGVFADENFAFKASLGTLTAATAKAVPANTPWVRYEIQGAVHVDDLYVTRGSAAQVGYRRFGEGPSPWQNKRGLIPGDSLTAQGYYIRRLTYQTGMLWELNGINGATMGDRAAHMALTDPGATGYMALDNIDHVYPALSTNDFSAGTALGTVTDSAATATLCGAMRKMVDNTRTRKPTIERIGFIGPAARDAVSTIPASWGAAHPVSGLRLQEYDAKMAEWCAYHGHVYISPLKGLGWNSGNTFVDGGGGVGVAPGKTVDGLHFLATTGALDWGDYVGAKINLP